MNLMRTFRRLGPFVAGPLAAVVFLTLGTPYARAQDDAPVDRPAPRSLAIDDVQLPDDVGSDLESSVDRPLSQEEIELQQRLRNADAAQAPTDNPAPEASTYSLPTGEAKSAVTPSRISLPNAEGSIEGMGESFAPVLSSGTATFSVPIALPAGRNGVQPSLGLSYASTGGNSSVGFGWSMSVPFIVRQSDLGLSRYIDENQWHGREDRFFYNGGQELVPVDSAVAAAVDSFGGAYTNTDQRPSDVPNTWQQYRARIEGGFMRFFRSPDSTRWVVQGKDGTRFDFGLLPSTEVPVDLDTAPSLQTEGTDGTGPVYGWFLTRMSDVFGSTVYYRYRASSGGQRYLDDVYYLSPNSCAGIAPAGPSAATSDAARTCTLPLSDYGVRVHVDYEARPDVYTSYTSGWGIAEAERVTRIVVTAAGGMDTVGDRQLVRRYHLTYDDAVFHSLLSSVQVEGRPDVEQTGNTATWYEFTNVDEATALAPGMVGRPLPAMTFDYTEAPAGHIPGHGGVAATVYDIPNSPSVSADAARADLFDVNTDGLPDLVVTDPARYQTSDGAPAAGVFFNGFAGSAATPAYPASFSEAVPVGLPVGLSGTLNLASNTIMPMDVEGDGRSDFLHLPRRDRYGFFAPTRMSDSTTGNSVRPSQQGWRFTYADVVLPTGGDPRIDLVREPQRYRTMDVNGDHLIDILKTSGSSMQTWLNLGMVPGGEGQFGQAIWNETTKAWDLSNDPYETCLMHDGLPLDFSDPELRTTDMNGDGLVDLVRLRRGRLLYWPARGTTETGAPVFGLGPRHCPAGFASGREIRMASAPAELNVDLEGVYLSDVNGDGAADVIQVRFDEVDVWFNEGGEAFTERVTISTPAAPGFSPNVRLADIDGSGTLDIVYTNAGRWQYIDLAGGTRARLLSDVQNGLGASTHLTYGSSADDYIADLVQADDDPTGENFTWSKVDGACDRVLSTTEDTGPGPEERGDCVYRSGGSPVISTVVRQVETDDHFDELGRERNITQTEFAYHDGYYEGIEQEFRGFGATDAIAHGDANHPTAITRKFFRQGRRPSALASDRLADNPREALKGREWLTEVFDETGTYLSSIHGTVRIRHLMQGLDGRGVYYGFICQTDTLRYGTTNGIWGSGSITVPSVETDYAAASDGAVSAPFEEEYRTLEIRMADWAHIRAVAKTVDNVGQILTQEGYGRIADSLGSLPDPVITEIAVPDLPDGHRWQWLPLRQYALGREHCDGSPCRLGFASFDYGFGGTAVRTSVNAEIPDSAPAYQFGGDSFGAEDFGVIHNQALTSSKHFTQWGTPDETCAGGDIALSRDTCARYSSLEHDTAYAQLPLTESFALHRHQTQPYCDDSAPGSTYFCMISTGAVWDRGFGALLTATEPNGRSSSAGYDGLGRITAIHPPTHPGDACPTRPTQTFEYTVLADGLPINMVEGSTHDRCSGNIIRNRSYVDGLGRPRASLQRSEEGIGGGGRKWSQNEIAQLSARGSVTNSYNPAWVLTDPPTAGAAVGVPDEPFVQRYYDAFDRPVRVIERDASESQISYGALETTFLDPLDTGINGSGNDDFLGTGTITRADGHGRTTEQVLVNRLPGQGGLDNQYYRVLTEYRNDGSVLGVKRVQTLDEAPVDYDTATAVAGRQLERRFTYDTIGRRIGTVDPDSDSQDPNNPLGSRGWRYLFNTVGDLIAVRDSRGCGQNFYYDHAGRLVAEDYVECAESELPADHPLMDDALDSDSFAEVGVTPPASVQPDVRHYFDSTPHYVLTGDMPPLPSGTDLVGRLTGTVDRGQRSAVDYDLRGRPTWNARQMAILPDPTGAISAIPQDRPQQADGTLTASPSPRIEREYADHTYISTTAYDRIDRPIGLTLPADPDYGGTGPAPVVGGSMVYNTRGLPQYAYVDVDSWHRQLWYRRYYVSGQERLHYLRGDTGEPTRLTTVNYYDDRLRPTRSQSSRPSALTDSATPGSTEMNAIRFPADNVYVWDAANNLVETRNNYRPWDYPAAIAAEYEPERAYVTHDALYRVVGIDYEYRKDTGVWSSNSGPATDWRNEQSHPAHFNADPMRRRPAPMVSAQPDQRPINFTYQYDWLANQTEWTDDANAFYERSLGANILNGHEAGRRPAALYLASNIMSGGPVDPMVDRGGWVSLEYGGSGNAHSMTVRGQCHDTALACADPGGNDPETRDAALAQTCVCDVEQHYQYRWDELNRLVDARRYDRTGSGSWTIATRQRYRYDGSNVRMVKESRDQMIAGTDPENDATDGLARVALYVYPGDFERRGLLVGPNADHSGKAYVATLGTTDLGAETQYLIAGARLVWKRGASPGNGGTGFENEARLTYAVTNLIQSTSAVIDVFSGQLIERGTYLPNGVRETLRTERSEGFSLEPAGFTGKEGDDEVGLIYFGERYLLPHIGRWASPDPLQVHQGSGGEFGNSYHYVSGSLLQTRDPAGLCGTGIQSIDAMCEEALRPFGALVEFWTGGDYTHGSASTGHEGMDGVGGAYGGAVRAATLRLIPWESDSSEFSVAGGEIGASFVPIFGSLMDLIMGESVAGRHVSRTEAAFSLALDVGTLGLGIAGDEAVRAAVRGRRAPTAGELAVWRKRIRALRSALDVAETELEGTRLAIQKMESFGWETVGGGQYNNSGHGLDLVFRRGDEIAILEAKSDVLKLRVDTNGIQQGSVEYIETRLRRALAAGKTHIGDVSIADIQRALDEGRVKSYVSTTRNGGEVYEVDLSQAQRRTPARARRLCAGEDHGC